MSLQIENGKQNESEGRVRGAKPSANTKNRILDKSLFLFNKKGTRSVTTNHIAEELLMSPGNLYFHFSNKEEIIRELFLKMTQETYSQISMEQEPSVFLRQNLEIFWKYRFLHREMYELRRRDPELTKVWKSHLEQVKVGMEKLYKAWRKNGWVKEIPKSDERQFLYDVFLMMASSSLQVFESAEKEARKDALEKSLSMLERFFNFSLKA